MTSTMESKSQSNQALHLSIQLEMARLVHHALAEDLGVSPETVAKLAGTRTLCEFDATTAATVGTGAVAKADFVVKQAGVVVGLQVAQQVFETVDPSILFESLIDDGTVVTQIPAVIARVSGSAQSILVAERTALNILQRLCGVATATKEYVQKTEPFGIAILDTRKTTPGMRLLEKYAVRAAGGTNHRIGLFDALLIKDNHVRIAGGITQAINKVRAKYPGRPLEIEVTNQTELTEAVQAGAEKILLDNMTPQQIRQAVQFINGRSFIEVSGGVNLGNIDQFLIRGVDAISIGAITHSVRSLDISLEIEG